MTINNRFGFGVISIHPPVLALNRTVGATEEGTVDLSSYIPHREARYALFYARLWPNPPDLETALDVTHYIYDNLVDYNTYGAIRLQKQAATLFYVDMPWIQYIVKLTDRRYGYDIGATWGANKVSIQHWLIGYLL